MVEIAEVTFYEVGCKDCQWPSRTFDSRSRAEEHANTHEALFHAEEGEDG